MIFFWHKEDRECVGRWERDLDKVGMRVDGTHIPIKVQVGARVVMSRATVDIRNPRGFNRVHQAPRA